MVGTLGASTRRGDASLRRPSRLASRIEKVSLEYLSRRTWHVELWSFDVRTSSERVRAPNVSLSGAVLDGLGVSLCYLPRLVSTFEQWSFDVGTSMERAVVLDVSRGYRAISRGLPTVPHSHRTSQRYSPDAEDITATDTSVTCSTTRAPDAARTHLKATGGHDDAIVILDSDSDGDEDVPSTECPKCRQPLPDQVPWLWHNITGQHTLPSGEDDNAGTPPPGTTSGWPCRSPWEPSGNRSTCHVCGVSWVLFPWPHLPERPAPGR